MGYSNNKYFRMSYVRDIYLKSQIIWISYSSPPGAPAALGPWEPCGAFGPCPLCTIHCLCDAPLLSLSHWQAPQTSLPRPNCHNHWLISYTLLHFLPDSSAASASPCGNLALQCWRSWCGMVGVELPRRKRGVKGTRPSTSAARPT